MDSRKTSVIVGNPGSGKTTKLLSIIEEALVAGVSPREIAFISFSRKAADEGKQRAIEKFGLSEESFPHFRTIHSTAFKFLGLRRDQVVQWSHLRELGLKLGLEFKGKDVADDDVYGMASADRILFLDGLAKNTLKPLRKVWEDAFEDSVDWFELERFSRALAMFKKSRMLVDFNDMLEKFCSARVDQMPRLKLLIVDECQDTSLLQWRCIELMAENAESIYIAGDDMQALYQWSGADVETFLSLEGSVEVLEQSYRIPRSVHEVASSIGSRILRKRKKTWRPKDEVGSVNWFTNVDEVDLSSGTWLLLARNGYMLDELEDWCLDQGFSFNSVNRDPLKSPALEAVSIWERLRKGDMASAEQVLRVAKYMGPEQISPDLIKKLRTEEASDQHSLADLNKSGLRVSDIWHKSLVKISPKERDFFIAARKRGEALLKKPRIVISTIHASKGGEADHVLLLTDMSLRCYQNMNENPDPETRVWFVGTTRCRQSLNIVQPRTNLCYEI